MDSEYGCGPFTVATKPEYSRNELSGEPGAVQKLVEWIQSDDQLRTDDEILEEAIGELGFDRRGSRIAAALSGAIEAWRQQ